MDRTTESRTEVVPLPDLRRRPRPSKGQLSELQSKFNRKYWWEMTEDEHQKFPGGYEIQVSQGPHYPPL
jgi:hypothetical protein